VDNSVCVWIGGELAWAIELPTLWPRLGPLLTEAFSSFSLEYDQSLKTFTLLRRKATLKRGAFMLMRRFSVLML